MVSCRRTVKVLSSEDGKQSIVQAAQQLCRSVENKERSPDDISVNVLDALLRGTMLWHPHGVRYRKVVHENKLDLTLSFSPKSTIRSVLA